ncbi:MAG: tRNA lysidine(34) synthetase TilS [Holosporaceae bacterium]|jgi:tRNA(Ile)-lysidine synthase|nr:tRNA lysidine(34) synthetase TilS [Holosporaceae bacterium]
MQEITEFQRGISPVPAKENETVSDGYHDNRGSCSDGADVVFNFGNNFVSTSDSEFFFAHEIDELISVAMCDNKFAGTLMCHDNSYAPRICCAVSGGPDSMALLTLARDWAQQHKHIQIICVTVDHQLRPESNNEARFVENFCHQRNIPHEILVWQRSSAVNVPQNRMEILARDARYSLIRDFCHRQNINVVLTGHNWNDQLETFKIRQFRGSSDHGLACMSRVRSLDHGIKLVRPLLHFSKQHLADFLYNQNVSWQRDPMNDCDKFIRSVIRKQIFGYDQMQLQTASNRIMALGKQRRSIEINAVEFLCNKDICWHTENENISLNLQAFVTENPQIQREILKRIIWNVGGKEYQTRITEAMLQKILAGDVNTIGRCLIKIKGNVVHILPEHRKSYGYELSTKNFAQKSYKSKLGYCKFKCNEFKHGLLYANQGRRIPGKNVDFVPNRIGLLDVFVV